ncbi:MAG: efflux RND transporter periplasmic adaptor subunit [Ferruginibacter sp.]|nr:efflux RND transporter periplasmic adaptor subunit [Ferruginibacter sp.]
MKKNIIMLISIVSIAIVFIACTGKDNSKPIAAAETPKEEEAKHENPNEATLTTEQMKTIGIQLGSVEQKQLTASLKTNGVLKVPNQNRASINSIYSGVIKSLLVQPGNAVKKGQTIATIANPEFIQVQSEYQSINSKIVFAEQEYNRQKELQEGNAGALKNLQNAETELRILRSRKASLQQQISLMGVNPLAISNGKLVSVLSVRSPINGVVSSVTVKMGSYIDLSTVIAEVVDNSQLHLDLFVYEKDLPKLKNNQTIHFTVTNDPGKEYDAQIFSLGSSFENESKAVSVHAMVKGDKTGLIDGMNVTANISLDKATLPAVPTEAIVSYQGKDYIFIVDAVNAKENTTRFKRIPVVKGTSEVGYSEITLLEELPANAKVVTKAAFFILAKQTNIGEEE